MEDEYEKKEDGTETATFAGGCFWCVEAAFEEVRGVVSATSGYCGGDTPGPTYEQVCAGKTGHAEAVRVEYNPNEVSYRDLLKVFFKIHNPTTKNRQGPDVGSQYRSAVYYENDEQREAVEAHIDELEGDVYDGIVTEVEPLEEFYVAEEYHQNYFDKQRTDDGKISDPYCRVNIPPKIDKVHKTGLAE